MFTNQRLEARIAPFTSFPILGGDDDVGFREGIFRERNGCPCASFSTYRLPLQYEFSARQYGHQFLENISTSASRGGAEVTDSSLEFNLPETSMTHDQLLCCERFILPTQGDGNCLLHALSLGMWGVHSRLQAPIPTTLIDEQNKSAEMATKHSHPKNENKLKNDLTTNSDEFIEKEQGKKGNLEQEVCVDPLRILLSNMMNSSHFKSSTEPKYQYERQKQYQKLKSKGLDGAAVEVEVDIDVDKEWNLNLSDAIQPKKFLGPLHLYALAQVLRRPIIVYEYKKSSSSSSSSSSSESADEDISNSNSDEEMAGLYLPLMWGDFQAQRLCSKEPLMLFYHQSHFTAVVFKEEGVKYAPLYYYQPLSELVSSSTPSTPSSTTKLGNSSNDDYSSNIAMKNTNKKRPANYFKPSKRIKPHSLKLRYVNPGDDTDTDIHASLLEDYLNIVTFDKMLFAGMSSDPWILPQAQTLRDAHIAAMTSEDQVEVESKSLMNQENDDDALDDDEEAALQLAKDLSMQPLTLSSSSLPPLETTATTMSSSSSLSLPETSYVLNKRKCSNSFIDENTHDELLPISNEEHTNKSFKLDDVHESVTARQGESTTATHLSSSLPPLLAPLSSSQSSSFSLQFGVTTPFVVDGILDTEDIEKFNLAIQMSLPDTKDTVDFMQHSSSMAEKSVVDQDITVEGLTPNNLDDTMDITDNKGDDDDKDDKEEESQLKEYYERDSILFPRSY